MTAINKIISIFFFAIWSAFVSAADSSIRKVNKFGEIQMNKVGQNLQEMEIAVCDDKSLALLLCETDVGMTSCYDCASQLSIPIFNTCSWSSEVESFCNAGGSCMNAFRQDCKDELQTVLTCLLSPCDADTWLLLESSFGVALAIFFVAKGHRTSKLPWHIILKESIRCQMACEWESCMVDQCSLGFTLGYLVASALGAVVTVWMLVICM